MGTSKSPEQLASKFVAYVDRMATVNRKATSEAALVYKNRLIDGAARDAGGDRRLSHWKFRDGQHVPSPRLGAGYDLEGSIDARAVVKARPGGIWGVLEGGAAQHVIAPKPAKGRRKKGWRSGPVAATGGLTLPPQGDGDDGVRRRVVHPGTRPKRTFTKAKAGGERPAMKVFAAAQTAALVEVFK